MQFGGKEDVSRLRSLFSQTKSIFTHKGGFIPSIILFPLITITKNTRETTRSISSTTVVFYSITTSLYFERLLCLRAHVIILVLEKRDHLDDFLS